MFYYTRLPDLVAFGVEMKQYLPSYTERGNDVRIRVQWEFLLFLLPWFGIYSPLEIGKHEVLDEFKDISSLKQYSTKSRRNYYHPTSLFYKFYYYLKIQLYLRTRSFVPVRQCGPWDRLHLPTHYCSGPFSQNVFGCSNNPLIGRALSTETWALNFR